MSEHLGDASNGRRSDEPATTHIPHEPDGAATVKVAAAASPGAGDASRVGYVPTRANRVRDGIAIALLIGALLLPWSTSFGLGVPGSDGDVALAVYVVTLLAIAAALVPHVGPWRLTAEQANAARTARVRLWLCVAYIVGVLGFIGFHILESIRDGGTGEVPPGAGPGLWLGVAGALLAAQPPITSITLADNNFDKWFAAARVIGIVSIVLAALSVAFNLFWRVRYLFVTDVKFAGADIAVVISTLLYGAVAMIAVLIASLWLIEKTAAARLATTALGAAAALAGVLVWVAAVGRDVDAFHGIAQNTSTAAVGYEGYLAWAAAAAIVAPTTLYAVFLVKPPTLAVYRNAALKCLLLIAFWSFAAAGLRVTDYLIALSLDLPHRIYDSVALTGFNIVTGCIAVWLRRRLATGGLSTPVIGAFSAVLAVFTAAQLVIGVALAPRYADPTPRNPNAIYGNDLAQQITSTFDVVICALSLAILVAVLVTGPLAGYVLRRREIRKASPKPAAPDAKDGSASPTVALPEATSAPKIVRQQQDSTTAVPTAVSPAVTTQIPAPTTALRIQRRPTSAVRPADDAAAPTTALRIRRRPKAETEDAAPTTAVAKPEEPGPEPF